MKTLRRSILLLELTTKFKKGNFQSKSEIIALIKSMGNSKLKWIILLHNFGIPSTQAHIKNNQ